MRTRVVTFDTKYLSSHATPLWCAVGAFGITGEDLREARHLAKLSQRQLAELSGVSKPTITRLELQTGALRANLETVRRLVAALEQAGVRFTERGVELKEG